MRAELLTAHQKAILDKVAEGKGNAQIGAELLITVDTVKATLQRIYDRIGAKGPEPRANAVALHVRAGLPVPCDADGCPLRANLGPCVFRPPLCHA